MTWQNPPIDCEPGALLYPFARCNPQGDGWIADWENEESVQELSAGAKKKCSGCSDSPASLVRLGAEIWQAAFEKGLEFGKTK